MAATDIAFFTERLTLKEQELGELKSAFHTYKLKQKVKYDNLKKDVYAFCRTTGQSEEEKDNVALMQIKVAELETELEEAKRNSEGLQEELNKRQTQLNDHMILIKSLETRLKEMSPETRVDRKSQNIDMERVQQQMLYKDQRIIELNNSILEKERQILDLQEMCREQGEVADVKKQAMKIVQKKFEEMESRGKREVGTETDPWFAPRQRDMDRGQRAGGASRSLSPGHAIVSRAAGGSSPPPLDPQFDTEAAGRFEDDDMSPGTSSGFQGKNLDEEVTLRKKERKRVTFDLPPSAGTPTMNLAENNAVLDQLNATIARLTEENSRLMADLDTTTISLVNSQNLLDESEKEVSRLLRDTKNSSLKARAVAHSRIRDLEETLAGLNEDHVTQSTRYTTEIETLRSTREWEIEQNGLLRDQIDKLRDKNIKLTAEVDATRLLNIDLEKKIDEMRNLMEGVSGDLDEAEELVVFLEDQKESMLDDVEKMKDALFAQDEYIKLLETDNVIYEEHIGILRDSLGASKVDHRSLLRSKAFETKLKALEQEKEQISIKSREEKLKTKALAQKVKILEEENEKLMERLCEKEMGAADDADMSETCRQLEARLRESDQQMNYVRTQFEIELEAVRVENRQRQTECENLKYQLYSLENKNVEQHHAGAAGPNHQPQQTQLAQQDNSQEVQDLRDQVQVAETRVRELVQTISTLESELDTVRVTNFELQDRLKETEEIETDYDELIEKHRTVCTELVSVKEALQADVVEKEKLQERAESAEKEVTRLGVELDGTRSTYNENVAIKQELEEIKEELEQERAVVQQKWEDVCRRAFETPSEPGSRKSSMEIQNQQYMIAFEDKIQKLEEDLFEMTSKLAESEIEKQDLRRQLEKIQEIDNVRLANEEEQAQKLMVANDQLEQELEKKTEDHLLAKISDLELEASLAGELSVEMGRVIQHMEKQIADQKVEIAQAGERAHSAQMELRLHEMLNEELGIQLDDLKEREKVWTVQQEGDRLEADKKSARIEDLNQTLASQTKEKKLLVQQIQELESRLTVSVAETKDVRSELQESRDEVREVQGELKDAQMAEVQRQANSQEHFNEPAVYQTQKEYQQAYAQWYYSQAGHSHPQYLAQYQSSGTVPQNSLRESQLPVQQEAVPQPPYSQSQLQYPVQQPETSHTYEAQTVSHTLQNQLQYPTDSYQTTDSSHTHTHRAQNVSQYHQSQLQYPAQSTETPDVHNHEACTSHHAHPAVPSSVQSGQLCTSHVHLSAVHPSTTGAASSQSQGEADSLEQVQNENEILRQCVNETIQLREDMSQDVEKLLELKNELEIAVNSLKGEIWTLNGQLKASILDRENLEDRVVSLDTSLMEEKKKVTALDVELSEHQELIEKATRQAAEAENESNRRLAECLEMETRRIELEEAYSQLTEYYNQLQAAYNLLYAQQQGVESGDSQKGSQAVDSTVVGAINQILEELSLPVEGEDIRTKLNAIQEKIRQKIEEVEQLQTAVSEQSRVSRALEDRLEAVEEDQNVSGGQQLELRSRVEQLEGDLEWKQEECDSLRRQVDELQHSLNTIIVNDKDDSLATSRLRTELAILAARLATRQADVDSLFRTNAELAHTNVRLQNELEENEDGKQENEGQQALAARVQELEKKLADWADSKDEIERLKSIEKVLNKRILSLEDQLLEKEEQLQEMEERVMESGGQDKIQTLEAANEAVIVELEELRKERDTLRVSIQTKEKEQSREKEQAQEEVRAYQDELEEMKTELETLKTQLAETEERAKLETVQPTQSQWEDWGGKTEDDGLKEELTVLRTELAKALEEQKEKESLFEEEMEILKKELEESQTEKKRLEAESQKDENWGGWDEKTESQEADRLEKALEAAHNSEEELRLRNMELEEELRQRDESHSQRTSLERELDTVRRELEDLKKLESQESREDNWGEWDEKTESQEVQRLEKALEEAKNSQEELKLRNMELEEEVTTILKQREGQGEDRTSLERELDSVRQELETLTRDTELGQSETEDVEELKLTLEETQQNIEDLKLRNLELEEKVKNLSSRLEVQSTQNKDDWGEWEKDKEQEHADSQELKSRVTELEEMVRDYNQLAEETQRVREQLEETERTLADRTRELESLKKPKAEERWTEGWGEDSPDGVDQLKKELEATNRERMMMEAVIMRVERENEDLMGQLEEAGVVEREMHKEVETTRTALTELQQEVQLLREEKPRLEMETTQNVKSDDAWGDNWKEEEDLSQKQKKELEECQNKLATISTTLQSVEQTLRVTQESAQQRQVELEERIQSLETELDTAQFGSEELKEKEERLKTVETRLTELEKQNSLLKESEGRLLESVDEWGAIADKNQEEVDRLQKVVNGLETERHSLLEEVKLLKTEIAKLKTSQPKDTDLQSQLLALKTERDSLKEQLTAMSTKLSEVEKEKNQVKTAYDQLKAKIQARRAAAQAAGSSNTPSRAPSRASVASIGEIREDPTELAYQVPVHVQAPQTSYSQAVDARVQEFLDDVKDFLCRLDSISLNQLDSFNETEQDIDPMGKRKTRAVSRSEETALQVSSCTDFLEQKLSELVAEKSILEEKLKIAEERLERTCQASSSLKLSDEEVLRLHDEVERLKAVEKESQEENQTLTVNLEVAVKSQDELRCQLEQSLTVTESLRTEVDVLRMDLELKETEAACQEKKLESMAQELGQKRTELGSWQVTDRVTESLRTEVEVLRMDLELRDKELPFQQTKLETLTEELGQTSAEVELQTARSVQREPEELQKASSDRETVSLEARDTLKGRDELQSQLDHSLAVIESLRSELGVLRMELELKETEATCHQEKMESLTEEPTRTQDHLQHRIGQDMVEADLVGMLHGLEWKLRTKNDDISNLMQEIRILRRELQQARTTLRIQTGGPEEEESVEKESEDRLDELMSMDNHSLRTQNAELKNELANLKAAVDQLQTKILEMEQESGILTGGQTDYQNQMNTLTYVPSENDDPPIWKESELETLTRGLEEERQLRDRLEEDRDRIRMELEVVKEELRTVLNKEQSELLSRLQSLEDRTNDLTDSIEELEDLDTGSEERVQRLEEENSQLQSENSRLEEDLTTLALEVEQLEARMLDMNQENRSRLEEITVALDETREERDSALNQLEVVKSQETDTVVRALETVQQERDSALNQLEVIKEELELAMSRSTVSELETVTRTLEEVQRERDSALNQLEVVKRRENDLEQLLLDRLTEIEARATLHSDKIEQLVSQESELQSLVQENERLSSLLVNYDSERNSMREALFGLHRELGQAVSHVQKVEESLEELERVKERNRVLTEEIDSLRKELERVKDIELDQTQSKELTKSLEELEAFRCRNQELTETFDQYQKEINSLRKELETVEASEEKLTSCLEETRALLDQKTEGTERLESQNQTLISKGTAQLEELSAMDHKRKNDAATIEHLESLLHEKIISLKTLENERQRDQELVKSLEERVREMEEERQRLAAEYKMILDTLTLSLSTAEDSLKWKETELENLTQENERLEKELEKAVTAGLEKESERQLLSEDLNSLEAELDMLTAKMLTMEQEKRQIQTEKVQQSSSREESLEKLRKEIEDKNEEISKLKEAIQKDREHGVSQLQHVTAQKDGLEKEKDDLNQKLDQLEEQLRSEQERSVSQLEHLQGQLTIAKQEKHSLTQELLERTEELKKSHHALTEGLRNELQRITDNHDRVQEELNQCQVALELSRINEESSSARLQQLEERLSELEADREQTQKLMTETNESLQTEIVEWKTKFEQAYSDLCKLHPALQHAQTSVNQLLAQNAELHQQVVTQRLERDSLLSRLPEQLEDSLAVLQLGSTVESVAQPLVQSASETRISMEDTVAECEIESSSDTRPLLPTFDDVIDRVSSSSFVRAGAPITQPLLRRLRAVWGRRAVRPYLRYCVAAYFVFLHFMLFNCWWNF